jgi:hypothetical protein
MYGRSRQGGAASALLISAPYALLRMSEASAWRQDLFVEHSRSGEHD